MHITRVNKKCITRVYINIMVHPYMENCYEERSFLLFNVIYSPILISKPIIHFYEDKITVLNIIFTFV